jgi:type II secretion system protein N
MVRSWRTRLRAELATSTGPRAQIAAAQLARFRRFAVPAAAVVTFALFLLITFPYDTLARRLEVEAQRAGADLKVGSVGPAFLGFRARDVRLRFASPSEEPSPELRLDSVTIRPDIFALLLGRTSFGFSLDAYGGSTRGHAAISSDPASPGLRSLRLDAREVDLHALPLKELAGLDVVGRVSLKVDIPALQPPDAASGTISASGKQLALAGGSVQGFTLPRTLLGDLDASVPLEKGVARVEKTQLRGGDIDVDLEGTVRLRPLLSLSQADLRLRLRPSDRWLNQNPALRGLLGLLQKQPDGSFLVPLTGPVSRLSAPIGARF